jgi:hypothetical protein
MNPNGSSMVLEIAVLLLGVGVLVAGLWSPAETKRQLGYVAALIVGIILLISYSH